jgi:hypothetical protein
MQSPAFDDRRAKKFADLFWSHPTILIATFRGLHFSKPLSRDSNLTLRNLSRCIYTKSLLQLITSNAPITQLIFSDTLISTASEKELNWWCITLHYYKDHTRLPRPPPSLWTQWTSSSLCPWGFRGMGQVGKLSRKCSNCNQDTF